MGNDHTPTAELRIERRPDITRAGLEPLDGFSAEMAQLDKALSDLAEQGDDALQRAVMRMRADIHGFEPSVTLLGQVKAGKTALVNAMAGWSDLLPSDVNPWTSVVTSLHLTPHQTDSAARAEFKFFGANEWDRLMQKGGRLGEMADRAGAAGEIQKIREQIEEMREKSRARLGKKFELLLGQSHEYGYFDKNLIERYICLGDLFDDDPDAADQGRYADITKSADLYLQAPDLPVALCLRDTPGVNDTFMMREQVTIQAIRDSRLCVLVLSAHQALSSVDMAVIRLISNLNTRNVIIFVNRIDELPDPAAQIEEIRTSIRDTLKAQNGPEDCEIVFGSAYWAGKVLANDIENMAADSADALLNWASQMIPPGEDQSPAKMVWELSGLPALFRAIGTRVVNGQGKDLLTKTARNAMNLASSLKVSEAITVSSDGDMPALVDRNAIATEIDMIAKRHYASLKAEMGSILKSYHARSDRAHGNFLDRATHSLIKHLEEHGESPTWSYDPTGLRMLLRSAYTVFGTQTRNAAQRQYDAAATEIAHLYGKSFGGIVNGFSIEAPTAPDVTPPVGLGQTIALDFKDGWWSSWWRRTRGYKAFAESFRSMIKGETDMILAELKHDQADAYQSAVGSALTQFIDEQRALLLELADKAQDGTDAFDAALTADDLAHRRAALEDTMRTLSTCAA